ncbi:hypothetical protein FN846DRAFT_886025 [Sphaerosporella brunnea]|uniref:Uncharacterized protein n=1 Tax=Sphaerosporella brunnea TaxID=1250544 RepID=A0A5J5FB50_9PEZI|nr:hypothetical protein FN846DRAFT_886025 [Sphaerosporella brunnea]
MGGSTTISRNLEDAMQPTVAAYGCCTASAADFVPEHEHCRPKGRLADAAVKSCYCDPADITHSDERVLPSRQLPLCPTSSTIAAVWLGMCRATSRWLCGGTRAARRRRFASKQVVTNPHRNAVPVPSRGGDNRCVSAILGAAIDVGQGWRRRALSAEAESTSAAGNEAGFGVRQASVDRARIGSDPVYALFLRGCHSKPLPESVCARQGLRDCGGEDPGLGEVVTPYAERSTSVMDRKSAARRMENGPMNCQNTAARVCNGCRVALQEHSSDAQYVGTAHIAHRDAAAHLPFCAARTPPSSALHHLRPESSDSVPTMRHELPPVTLLTTTWTPSTSDSARCYIPRVAASQRLRGPRAPSHIRMASLDEDAELRAQPTSPADRQRRWLVNSDPDPPGNVGAVVGVRHHKEAGSRCFPTARAHMCSGLDGVNVLPASGGLASDHAPPVTSSAAACTAATHCHDDKAKAPNCHNYDAPALQDCRERWREPAWLTAGTWMGSPGGSGKERNHDDDSNDNNGRNHGARCAEAPEKARRPPRPTDRHSSPFDGPVQSGDRWVPLAVPVRRQRRLRVSGEEVFFDGDVAGEAGICCRLIRAK